LQKKGKTILLTTHYMEEAERLSDRVAILNEGKLVALDKPSVLIHNLAQEARVIFNLDVPLPDAFIDYFAEHCTINVDGERVTVSSQDTQYSLVSEVVNRLSGFQVNFRDLRTEQANLEDVFIKLTGQTMRE